MNSIAFDESEVSAMNAILNGRKYTVTVDVDDARDFMTAHHQTHQMVRAAHVVRINGVRFVIEAGKTQEIPEIVMDNLYQSTVINPDMMPAVKPIGMDAYGNTINYNMISY